MQDGHGTKHIRNIQNLGEIFAFSVFTGRVKRTYGLIEKNAELTTSSRDAQLSARFLSELMVQKPQSCEKGHVERGNVPISQVEEVKTAFFCSDQMYALNQCVEWALVSDIEYQILLYIVRKKFVHKNTCYMSHTHKQKTNSLRIED